MCQRVARSTLYNALTNAPNQENGKKKKKSYGQGKLPKLQKSNFYKSVSATVQAILPIDLLDRQNDVLESIAT